MKSILKYERAFVNSAEHNNNMSQKKRWHRVLGHINFGYLNTLVKGTVHPNCYFYFQNIFFNHFTPYCR